PQVGVAAVAQHDESRLEARHREQRVPDAAGQTQRGERLADDLAVDGHQAPGGARAGDAPRPEHHDDEREPQEDLRGKPHRGPYRPSFADICTVTGNDSERNAPVELVSHMAAAALVPSASAMIAPA